MKVPKSVEEERKFALSNASVKIRKLRKAANMTQAELANIVCVSNRTISKWEKGISSPDYGSLRTMARVFDVKVSYFIDDTSAKSRFKLFINMVKDFIKRRGIITIFVILFFLLLFYFIITIRSFAVFEIVSNDKNLTFESGYYIKSNFKIIVNINNITYKEENNEKDIISQKLKLCTVINADKECFYESENMEDIDYKSFVGYSLKRNIARKLNDNLYLVVETIYEDNTANNYELKLPMKKVISSDMVIYPKVDLNGNELMNSDLHNIDYYKLDNNGYTRIENTNTYYKDFKKYILYFDLDQSKMSYVIKAKDGMETYDYFYNQDFIKYNLNNVNGTIETKYSYFNETKELNCVKGNCNNYKETYNSVINVFNSAFL